MDSNIKRSSIKIKRRKFFIFSGASVFGLLTLKDIPLKLISKKFKKEISLKVKTNELAVKRVNGRGLNG